MNFQGKVFNWNDNKGFGFVEPNGGGERAFVHIKAFNSGARRPVDGDLIIYQLVGENNKRFTAENIKFARENKSSSKRNKAKGGRTFGGVFTLTFGMALALSVFYGKLPKAVAGVYLAMSLVTFITYAIDKFAAQRGRWRTKENTLHMFALIGGWPGAFFAQTTLRHKSSKQAFKSAYRVTVFLNVAGLLLLFSELGTNLLNNVIIPAVQLLVSNIS